MVSVGSVVLCLAIAVAVLSNSSFAKKEHTFSEYDSVQLKVNKVGPYANPSETYSFYRLPFCAPSDIQRESLDLGKVLEGDRIMNSLYDIRYLVNVRFQLLCKASYSTKEAELMRDAIRQRYYMQVFLDDLPVWSFIGEPEQPNDRRKNTPMILYSHLHLDIGYNGKRVVEVNASVDPQFRTTLRQGEPADVEFSYSVSWHPSEISFEGRMKKYETYSFFRHEVEVQWFSILNSLVLVALLIGLITVILLRVLKRDYEREEDDEDLNETGWKLLHGDVFRFPVGVSILSSILGCGVQLLCLAGCLFFLGLFDVFKPYSRGTLYAGILLCYAFTAWIAGYVSASWYRRFGGQNWVHNCILTGCLFSVPVFVIWFFLNTVAVVYSSTAALPFWTIVAIFFLNILVTFPLTVLGATAGRRRAGPFEAPCRARAAPRQIPPVPWFVGPVAQVVVAGLIVFSSVYVEIYYLFMSLWSHAVYTPYIIILLSFCIIITVTACVTVALTYFHLAQEDYRWWWRAICAGGSGAFFVFAHCFFFVTSHSNMEGFFQLAFYFGYMFLLSYSFFLVLATVGFFSALAFVKKIYRAVKFD